MARGGYYDSQGRWREGSPIKYKISRVKLIEALKEAIAKRQNELKEARARADEQNMLWPARYLAWAKQRLEEAKKEVVLATKATKLTNADALDTWWQKEFSSVSKTYSSQPVYLGRLKGVETNKEIEHIEALIRRLELSDEVDIQGTEVDDFMNYV